MQAPDQGGGLRLRSTRGRQYCRSRPAATAVKRQAREVGHDAAIEEHEGCQAIFTQHRTARAGGHSMAHSTLGLSRQAENVSAEANVTQAR